MVITTTIIMLIVTTTSFYVCVCVFANTKVGIFMVMVYFHFI